MMALTHASAGALAGEFIPNPYLAFLAGVILHLIMDKVPHFWPESSRNRGIMIITDTILPTLFILGFYFLSATRHASVIAGALGGVSVDFYFVLVMGSRGKWAQWHTDRQPHRPERLWFLTDAVTFVTLVSLLWLAVR